ncbi:hypothetical protein ACFC6U_11215 [Kitasatospora purpeofusca]|uniref:hypothetical protein n=1 Tax=Kitasatospora purpeofusca TaxID=67352 RepID=UPI0035DF4AD8
MVAGERPVARRRAVGECGGRKSGKGPAGALLVQGQLQGLARPVREHGAEAGQHRTRDGVGGPPPACRPPGQRQQQAQHQQTGLGGGLQQGGKAGRGVGDGLGDPAIAGR